LMSVRVPSAGQLAFHGNIRRAMKKVIAAQKSITQWIAQHPGWPVQLLSIQQQKNLIALATYCQTNLILTVPAAKPQ
jgi:hypothetical protein